MSIFTLIRLLCQCKTRHYELALPYHNDGWMIRRGGLSTDYEQEEA